MNRREMIAGVMAAAASSALPAEEMVDIQLDLTRAEARAIRHAAAMEGISVDEFVCRALEAKLEGYHR